MALRGGGSPARSGGVRDRALGLLAQRAHFRRELETKLSARGFAPDEVAVVLDELAVKGLVDDVATATAFVALRRRKGIGRARLAGELRTKGAAPEVITAVLEAGDPDSPDGDRGGDETASAVAVARRWLSTRRSSADEAALARHLERRGFTWSTIQAVRQTLRAEVTGPGCAEELDDEGSD